jgi:DNA-binding MltR family transcriptional regulator
MLGEWKPIRAEDLSKDGWKVYRVLNEGSDLACVLIGASYLDNLTANLVTQRFVKTSIAAKLLRPTGPLGPFGTRLDLAYCLGIINKDCYQDLQLVCEIRNQFAHSHTTLDFGDSMVSAACAKLKAWRQGDRTKPHLSEPATREEIRKIARRDFVLSVVYLLQGMRSSLARN